MISFTKDVQRYHARQCNHSHIPLIHKMEVRWFEEVSRAGTSNYIPHCLWDLITCPYPWYLLLAQQPSYCCLNTIRPEEMDQNLADIYKWIFLGEKILCWSQLMIRHHCFGCLAIWTNVDYHQPSDISRTLVGNKLVAAAPTTLTPMDWARKLQDETRNISVFDLVCLILEVWRHVPQGIARPQLINSYPMCFRLNHHVSCSDSHDVHISV